MDSNENRGAVTLDYANKWGMPQVRIVSLGFVIFRAMPPTDERIALFKPI